MRAAQSAPTPESALRHIERALSRVNPGALDQPTEAFSAVGEAAGEMTVASVGSSAAPSIRPDAVLQAAPRLFRALEGLHQIVAVVFGYIQREGIFDRSGCASMKEYAAKHLGVSTEALFDKLSRAGKAAWAAFPVESQRVVVLASTGSPELGASPPGLPPTSTLATLGTVLKWVPNRDSVIERVKSGEWTERDLKRLQSQHAAASKASIVATAPPRACASAGAFAAARIAQTTSDADDEPVGRRLMRRAIRAVEDATQALDHINAGYAPVDLMTEFQQRLENARAAVDRHVRVPRNGGSSPRTVVRVDVMGRRA